MWSKENKSHGKPLPITPETRLGALLDAYPELENVLLRLSPEYSHLKNPVLRRTIGKIATLQQVAKAGGIPIGTLINTLRQAAGMQEPFVETAEDKEVNAPDWLQRGRIAARVDARPYLDRGEHPIDRVLTELDQLGDGDILQLTAPFVPAPLIDLVKKKGFLAWTEKQGENLYSTYFIREAPNGRKGN